jgi:hypothetical protein
MNATVLKDGGIFVSTNSAIDERKNLNVKPVSAKPVIAYILRIFTLSNPSS